MQTPWWRGAVIYQIYPRSFADSNGDGIGDLGGALQRLDYVAALGVEAVWLSPVFRSPMVDHGYDISDYRDIDPVFGTLADFDAFLERAHILGLKVVIDQVYSHTSDRHPWFEQSRKARTGAFADWYVWADPKPGGGPPNNWQCWFGEAAWTWEPRRGQYYLHNFHPAMPDLNFHTPAVVDAVEDVARFWLDRGVDGLRLDVCNYYLHDPALRDNPPKPALHPAKPFDLQSHIFNCDRPENLAIVERLRALLDRYPDRAAIAEICSEDDLAQMIAYTRGPRRLHSAYSFAFLRDWPGTTGFVEVLMGLQAHPDVWPALAFSNHDVPRTATRWSPPGLEQAAARMHLALLMLLRGTIFLYQGEELGLPESEVPREHIVDPSGVAGWPLYKGRDGCRTPFPWRADAPNQGFSAARPWLPGDPGHRALAIDVQEADPGSTLAFARALIHWRRRTPAVRSGDLTILDAPAPLIALSRSDGSGEAVLGVFNPSASAQAWEKAEACPSETMQFSEGAAIEPASVALQPYGFAILQRRA